MISDMPHVRFCCMCAVNEHIRIEFQSRFYIPVVFFPCVECYFFPCPSCIPDNLFDVVYILGAADPDAFGYELSPIPAEYHWIKRKPGRCFDERLNTICTAFPEVGAPGCARTDHRFYAGPDCHFQLFIRGLFKDTVLES